MTVTARMALAAAAAASLLPAWKTEAITLLLDIRTPQQCPDGLTIRSAAGEDGMIDYDVSVDPEAIAKPGELYRGRVRAHAVLRIAAPEQRIASVTLHGKSEGRRSRYQFSLSPSAARSSQFQLGVALHEEDGTPTIGGGVGMRVHLAGFEPAGK